MKRILFILKIRLFLSFFACFAFSKASYSQVLTEQVVKPIIDVVTPKSPTVSAMEKYVDIPVDNYSGLPKIEFPISTMDCDGFKVPIVLSYHGGGVKVDEYASWVGLGWSIFSGGFISRQIVNQPDELSDVGYWDTSQDLAPNGIENYYANISQKFNDMKLLESGSKDFEPDTYTYNFMGFQGKFVIDPYNNFQTINIPQSDIKIELNKSNFTFTIIDDKGNKYFFDKKEYTNNYYFDVYNDNNKIPSPRTVSAWKLSKIDLYNSVDDIIFEYVGTSEKYDGADAITKYIKLDINSPEMPTRRVTSWSDVESYKLTNIKFGNQRLHFSLGSRSDYKENSSKKLDKIIYYVNSQSKQIAKFNYTYFQNTSGSKRLKLDSVKISDKVYGFEYYKPNELPNINSYSADFWGYYNGENNSSYIPSYERGGKVYSHSNRKSNLDCTKRGSLTRINYPTGGNANFNWEMNEYSFVSGQNIFEDVNTQKIHTNKMWREKTYTKRLFDIINTQSVILDNIDLQHSQNVTVSISSNNVKSEYKNGINFLMSCPYRGTINMNLNSTMKEDFLNKGTYQIQLITDGILYTQDGEIEITVKYFDDNSDYFNYQAGGLRISSIDYFNKDELFPVISKKYTYSDSNGKSTGVLPSSIPIKRFDRKILLKPLTNPCRQNFNFTVLKGSVQGFYGFTSKVNVGYSKVIVNNQDASGAIGLPGLPSSRSINGTTVLTYSSPLDHGIGVNEEYPFVPSFANDNDKSWCHGKLLSVVNLNNNSDTVSIDKNIYERIENHKILSGFSFGHIDWKVVFKGEIAGELICAESRTEDVYTQPYSYSTGNYRMIRKESSKFSDSGSKFTTISRLNYHNSYKNIITDNIIENNNGEVKTSFYYPIDGILSTPETVRNKMLNSNNISTPLKYLKINKHSNLNYTISEVEHSYKDTLNHILLKKEIDKSNGTPIETTIKKYTSLLQPLEFDTKYNNNKIAPDKVILYGYRDKIIATISGVSYSKVKEAMVEKSIGNLQNEMNSDIIKSAIDKIRLSDKVKNAQITSYTYHQLHGVKTITDANGKTTTYDYDDFGRLIKVKDHKGNIIKQVEYNYAQ